MASGIDRGTGGNSTPSTSLACTPGSNFGSGLAVLVIGYENTGTLGADPYSSIADSAGNTWTPRQNALYDPGASGAGTVCRIFTSAQNIATLTTGTTVTVTSSVAARWAYAFIQVPNGTYVTGGAGSGSGGTPTVTTGSISAFNLVIGGSAAEAANGSYTGDSDTTNGSWSTAQTIGYGTGNSSQAVCAQYKRVTAAGAQTYNPTQSGDSICAWIEVSGASAFTATSDDSVSSISDSPARTASAVRTGSDALASLAEAVSHALVLGRSTSDTLASLSEAVARSASTTRTTDDAISSISDAVARGATEITRSTADAISSLSEAVARGAAAFTRDIPDELASLSEQAVRAAIDLARTSSDALDLLSETAERSSASFTRSIDDAIASLAEAVGAIKESGGPNEYPVTAEDALATLSEAASRAAAVFTRREWRPTD